MSQELAPISGRQPGRLGREKLPLAIAAAGKSAAWRFIEFFTANIRNKNTRAAYAKAVGQFFQWREARRINQLDQIRPVPLRPRQISVHSETRLLSTTSISMVYARRIERSGF
jgi:hypothetical protein